MMLPASLQNVIDTVEEDSLVVVYVKKLICKDDIEFETIIKSKMEVSEKKFHYLTICYEAEEVPFPEPHVNRVYFFLPKSKHYSLVADAMYVAHDFERVIQVVGKKSEEVEHIYPPKITAPKPVPEHFTDEQVKQQTEMLKNEDLTKFPSAFQMTRNLLKTSWDSAKGVMSGRQLLVSSEEAHRRLSICESCPKYKEKRCVECGCFMEQKTHLEAATCPDNKW